MTTVVKTLVLLSSLVAGVAAYGACSPNYPTTCCASVKITGWGGYGGIVSFYVHDQNKKLITATMGNITGNTTVSLSVPCPTSSSPTGTPEYIVYASAASTPSELGSAPTDSACSINKSLTSSGAVSFSLNGNAFANPDDNQSACKGN